MTVIPAINATSFDEAKKQIEIAEKIFADLPAEALLAHRSFRAVGAKEGLIHIDVVDGQFAPNTTWGSPEELTRIMNYESGIKYEIHLMVFNPEAVLDAWLRTGLVKRVIVHLEAMTDPVYILEKCKKYGAEAMLAINPGTEAERLLAHTDDFKYFQILAVYPGMAGQKFKPEVLEKVKFLRKAAPYAKIEVDGGITPETGKLVKDAGADILVSASYIFASKNPRSAYEQLIKL